MWILATVFGVFAFIILMLSVPIDLAFTIEKDAAFRSKVRVGWMFNLIGKDFKRKAKPEREKPRVRKKRRRRVKPFLAMLRARGFLRRLLRLARDIVRISHVRNFRLNLRIGLDDPAETGILYGALSPILVQIRTFIPLDIQVFPDFEQAGLQGSVKGDVRIFPIQVIYVVTLFVLSPATIRATRSMVSAWRK